MIIALMIVAIITTTITVNSDSYDDNIKLR